MPKTIKILHIITDTNSGGAGRHLLTLIDAIDKNNFSIEAAVPTGSRLVPELSGRNIHYTEANHIADRSFSYRGYQELLKLIKKNEPDIVHTHASLSGRIAARMCNRPIVYTRHSVFEPSPKSTRFPLKQFMGYVNNRYSDKVIAVSPAAKEVLVKQGTSPEKISIIYNGVPPIKKCPENRKAILQQSYGIPPEAFVISQIARLDDIKGHDYTLDAAKIWSNDPDIIVVIAGSGPLENHLRKRIKDESIKNIIMAGFVRQIDELLNITDLQINTSYGSEATSLSLLEGMSLGIPAVASDFGGNPFVITNGINGFIYPQKDSAALANAVLKIKNNRDLYMNMSENSQTEYNNRFRVNVMARDIEKIYTSLLELTN